MIGKFEESKSIYEKAIQFKPNYAEAYNNLGILYKKMKKYNDSEFNYKKAIHLKHDYAEAYNNLGILYMETGKFDDSIKFLKKAIDINPNLYQAYFNLGLSLENLINYEEAIKNLKSATEIKKDYAEAFCDLGRLYKVIGKFSESETYLKKAIELKKDYADAFDNLSSLYLIQNKFKKAFELSEWRWETSQKIGIKLKTSKPRWSGEKNKVVYIWREQGIGDEILYSSIIPEIRQVAKKIIVNCDKRLIPLFKRSFSKDIVYESNRGLIKEDDYDMHIPMGSLPLYFRNEINSFKTASKGYLISDKEQTNYFKKKLKKEKNIKYIGLSWDSKSSRSMNSLRVISLEDIVTELNASNIQFINLQYGDVSKEIKEIKTKHGINIINFSDLNIYENIDGLSSLMTLCDCIVTVENLMVHLGGSLGIDTKVMLHFGSHSNWGYKVKNSYWYNSVKLYRQDTIGDWKTVLEKIKNDLIFKKND